MTDSASTTPTGITLNAAVQNCMAAYNQIFTAERAAGRADFDSRQKAAEAYRNAMPYLTSHGNIRGFIACIGQGMLLNIIRHDEGSKLLYAANTALGALPRELRAVGRPGDPTKTSLPEN